MHGNGINTIYLYRLETVDGFPIHINTNEIKYIKNNTTNTNWSDIFLLSNTTTTPDYIAPLSPEELTEDILLHYRNTLQYLK